VPVDQHGLIVAALPRDARLVYVTPSHQYPLGVSMSLSRRRALLAWAEQNDAAIVEDDYDSEFRFDARPIEPLQTLDNSGRVIYVGSFSKTMLPTGWCWVTGPSLPGKSKKDCGGFGFASSVSELIFVTKNIYQEDRSHQGFPG
jgi:DNA-binding transcriptional MocR family regulator